MAADCLRSGRLAGPVAADPGATDAGAGLAAVRLARDRLFRMQLRHLRRVGIVRVVGDAGHLRRRLDQRVGQHQPRLAYLGQRQRRFRAVLDPQAADPVRSTQHDAGEALAPVDGDVGFRPRQMAGKPVPVLFPRQRPVDPGRADLQVPGAADRVVHVQHRAHRVADRLAILDPDQGAVGAVGHDLHRGRGAAGDGHAHQLVAHVHEGGGDHGGDARVQPGELEKICVQSRKGGPLRPPPEKSGRY